MINIRNLGRFENTETGQKVNIKKGRNPQRGTDGYFFIRSGVRVMISDRDYHHNWEKIHG